MRKFLTNPIFIDNGGNLCLQEGPGPPQQGLVFFADSRANSIEIAIGLWECLLCRNTHRSSSSWTILDNNQQTSIRM